MRWRGLLLGGGAGAWSFPLPLELVKNLGKGSTPHWPLPPLVYLFIYADHILQLSCNTPCGLLAYCRFGVKLTCMVGIFVQINKSAVRPLGYLVAESGCWEWVGARSSSGYGSYDGQQAHRWMWEREVGPIPAGLWCHHVCANRGCVNPDHLMTVTPKEHARVDPAMRANLERNWAAAKLRPRKTHCINGHALTPDNVYTKPSTGGRTCRICIRGRCPVPKGSLYDYTKPRSPAVSKIIADAMSR